MRRIITFLVIGLLFSCSVDEEIIQPEDQIDQKFAVAAIGDCIGDVVDFPSGGSVTVLNNEDIIYLTVNADEGFELSQVNFQIAADAAEFPVENNGHLNPQKLAQKMSFSKGVESYTFEVGWTEEDHAFIAMNATFKQKKGPAVSGWLGDISGGDGKWSYMDYEMCISQSEPCTDFTAGNNNSRNITVSEAASIESWGEVKKLYLSLLDPEVPHYGRFDPSIWDLIDAFAAASDPVGDYKTIYTITDGECTASVELTITVVPDFSDPICTLNAGEDNIKTLTVSEARTLESWGEVKKQYLSLLADGVPHDGTFDPSIWNLIDAFAAAEDPVGDYTTIYTITDGECSDSVELTIRVVPD